MTNLNLTKPQINYLLYILENKGPKTITGCANYFICSKTNAKKILDKMMTVGLLYKNGQDYQLTKIAYKIALDYHQRKENLEVFLQETFCLNEEEIKELVSILLTSKGEIFFNQINKKVKILREIHTKKLGKKDWTNYDFKKYFLPGLYPITCCLYKKSKEDFSRLKPCILRENFEAQAYLEVNEDISIQLKATRMTKNQEGYQKKSVVSKISYLGENGKEEINSKNGLFTLHLPQDLSWYNLGQGLLQTGIYLTIESYLGLGLQVERVVCILTLNLFNI